MLALAEPPGKSKPRETAVVMAFVSSRLVILSVDDPLVTVSVIDKLHIGPHT